MSVYLSIIKFNKYEIFTLSDGISASSKKKDIMRHVYFFQSFWIQPSIYVELTSIFKIFIIHKILIETYKYIAKAI